MTHLAAARWPRRTTWHGEFTWTKQHLTRDGAVTACGVRIPARVKWGPQPELTRDLALVDCENCRKQLEQEEA